jgi:disulfide oxidoreductase YuzD
MQTPSIVTPIKHEIYIYIYMCVCVCVCCVDGTHHKNKNNELPGNIKRKLIPWQSERQSAL